MKLYKYTGTISEVSFRNRTACDIKLYDMNDRDKAPTRLEVFGALGKYILDIEGTDAEERYIPNDFYFDDNLYLWRIEVPGGCDWPAKIIAQSPDDIDQLEIFGGNRYGRNAPVTEWTVVKRSLHRLLCHGDAQRRFE
jgi:hypothetical protein